MPLAQITLSQWTHPQYRTLELKSNSKQYLKKQPTHHKKLIFFADFLQSYILNKPLKKIQKNSPKLVQLS